MSKQILSARSKSCMHLKKFNFFQSLPVRNTIQARTGPPKNSCINRLHWHHSKHNFFSIRLRISKDSSHRKRTNWFSEVITEILNHIFRESYTRRRKSGKKTTCIPMLKLINRDYKMLWLKSTGTFKERTQIPLKLTIEKIWCRQKS